MIASPSKYLPRKAISFLQQPCHNANYPLHSSEITITSKLRYLNILNRGIRKHHPLKWKQSLEVVGTRSGEW